MAQRGLKLHQIRCWSSRPCKKSSPCELRGFSWPGISGYPWSAELEVAGAFEQAEDVWILDGFLV